MFVYSFDVWAYFHELKIQSSWTLERTLNCRSAMRNRHSICLFCSCSSQYEDIIVQENVLMHLCDTILAKDGSNLQQHVSFSQKPTLSKYYHVIQVSYQKSGYV